jgi:hypothetical protein
VPLRPTPQTSLGDTAWADEASRIHDASAQYLVAAKAERQADADDQLNKWGNDCTVADNLPPAVSGGGQASAKFVEYACAAVR